MCRLRLVISLIAHFTCASSPTTTLVTTARARQQRMDGDIVWGPPSKPLQHTDVQLTRQKIVQGTLDVVPHLRLASNLFLWWVLNGVHSATCRLAPVLIHSCLISCSGLQPRK